MRRIAVIIVLSLTIASNLARAATESGYSHPEAPNIWKQIVAQANDVNAQLDHAVAQTPSDKALGVIYKRIDLVFDHEKLRPFKSGDHSVILNHGVDIFYVKYFNPKRWSIVAYDDNNQIGWVGHQVEVVYSYPKEQSLFEVATAAKAYYNGRLIATAEPTHTITSSTPYQIELHETHYGADGRPTYEGNLRIKLGSVLLDNIVDETALSGKKSRDIFYSWSSSGRYYSEGEDLCAGDTFVAACKARVSDNFDYPAGVQTLHALAEKGDLEAQYRLASIYHDGEHVAKDDKEAVKWYRLAADRGYTDAEYDLGVMYAQGTGVPKDIQEAIQWWRKAADQGNMNAEQNLGVVYYNGDGVTQDYKQAARLFQLAAKQGDDDARSALIKMYMLGQGVSQDDKEAVLWAKLLADKGNSDGQTVLGLIYERGQGLPQNYTEAARWYRLAGTPGMPRDPIQGNSVAQYRLGFLIENGLGVPQDDVEAGRWYGFAAEQGDRDAKVALAKLLQKMIQSGKLTPDMLEKMQPK